MAMAPDARSLAEIAQQITVDLGKLATGLAHAGADPQAIAGLHNMATMIGHLSTALGQGPVGGQAAMPGAAAGAPGPAEGAQPGGPPAQPAGPAAAPAGPQQQHTGVPGGSFHGAAAELQARMAAAHAKVQQQIAAA